MAPAGAAKLAICVGRPVVSGRPRIQPVTRAISRPDEERCGRRCLPMHRCRHAQDHTAPVPRSGLGEGNRAAGLALTIQIVGHCDRRACLPTGDAFLAKATARRRHLHQRMRSRTTDTTRSSSPDSSWFSGRYRADARAVWHKRPSCPKRRFPAPRSGAKRRSPGRRENLSESVTQKLLQKMLEPLLRVVGALDDGSHTPCL
jgi:hypothetical protein